MHNKRIALLVYNYFEEAELAEPQKALEDAGCTTVVVSPTEGPLTALQHVSKGGQYKVDVPLSEVDFNDYDALVVPGGVVNADKLRMEAKARDWVRTFVQNNKPVAVICHGPWLLVSAGVVQDRRLTSYFTLQDDIRNAGGTWLDDEVVIDGPLITSRTPKDLPAFNKALIQSLGVSVK